MRGPRLAARLVGLFVALAALGCAALTDPMQHEDIFREKQRKFSQFVRWGNLQAATAFIVADQREEFLALAPQLTDVRFTDYETLQVDLNDAMTEAKVDVLFTGYRLSSPVSRPMLMKQIWTRTGTNDWEVRVELEPMRKALGIASK
jgi:hypothetical protein